MKEPWTPAAMLVSDAETTLTAAMAADAQARDDESAMRVVAAVGRLVALERTVGLRDRVAGADLDIASLLRSLDRDAMARALEDAAIRCGELLASDEPDVPDLLTQLATRDRAEHELLGAAFLAARGVEDVERASSVRTVFDDAMAPDAWRLVASNDARQRARAAIAPSLRSRFWWWNRGAGLPPHAASALAAVAELVATFSDVRAHFESLVRAKEAWTKPVRAAVPLTTVRAWLFARAQRSHDGVSLAAAAGGVADERLVLVTDECEVSFVPPSLLVVDLLADRRDDARPQLRTGARHAPLDAVENAVERFSLELDAASLDAPDIDIVLPLRSGDTTVTIGALRDRERP